MSSVMEMSLGSLKEILVGTKGFIQSNVFLCKMFGFGTSSFDFVGEHKLELVGAGLGGFVAWYLAKVWYDQRTFMRIGIKTPPYRFFFGHYKEMLEKGYSEALRQWTQKYGKVYGVYEGHMPILITADADMVQEIYIKQFSSFSARRHFQYSLEDDDPKLSLFFSSKGSWKRQRNIINPTFTNSRLRELFGFIKLCSDRFVGQIDQHCGKSIPIVKFLRRYTMDVIFNCAFGVDIDCQRYPENLFYRKGVEMIDNLTDLRWSYHFSTYLPEFRKFLLSVSFAATIFFEKFTESRVLNDSFSWLIRNIDQTFERRLAIKAKRKDFVNILLENHNEDLNKNHENKSSNEFLNSYSEKKMTLEEIKLNMVGFLVAGFETTSSTLNFCFYMMAKLPEELKKLQSEVDAHFKNTDTPIDFDNLGKLEYLDMFIKEVLRFFPLASTVIGRRCTNASIINGICIPENLTIAVDCKTLHFDPEHWGPDAEEFNPSRFSPEIKRHPAAYLPFGLGPRTCVGMRFALLEVKLTLAKLLLKYDVVATPETPEVLHFNEASGGMVPVKPIMVAINPRSH